MKTAIKMTPGIKVALKSAVLWGCMICGGLIALANISRVVTIEHVSSHELRGLQRAETATRQYRSGMGMLLAKGIAGTVTFCCALAGIIMARAHSITERG